jgi:hypothetical protein
VPSINIDELSAKKVPAVDTFTYIIPLGQAAKTTKPLDVKT